MKLFDDRNGISVKKQVDRSNNTDDRNETTDVIAEEEDPTAVSPVEGCWKAIRPVDGVSVTGD